MSVKLLLYCTKGLPNIVKTIRGTVYLSCIQGLNQRLKNYHLNGKIVAECECEKVEEIICSKIFNGVGFDVIYDTCELLENELFKKSCLDHYHFGDYFGEKDNEPVGYALHLSNVKVFDEPKELSEYSKRLPNGDFQVLGNAPQNMMNVCEIKYLIEDYILISIQPQHLCKILNGEKTIEVRKKILNSLKEML